MSILRETCAVIGLVNIVFSIAGLVKIVEYSLQYADYYDQALQGCYSKVIVPINSVILLKELVASVFLVKGAFAKKDGYFLFWLGYNGFLLGICTFALFTAFIFILGPVKDLSHFWIVATIIAYWIKWIIVFTCYEDLRKRNDKIFYESNYFRFINEDVDYVVY